MTYQQTRIEQEVKRRIKLSIWAYAYEFKSHSIVPDSIFDFESYMVDLKILTGNLLMDFWFIEKFNPATGQWIHKHPQLERIAEIYEKYYTR